MIRYTPEVREEAAILCSIAACDRTFAQNVSISYAATWILASHPARILAGDAWYEVWAATELSEKEIYAEAEAMIRSGWSP